MLLLNAISNDYDIHSFQFPGGISFISFIYWFVFSEINTIGNIKVFNLIESKFFKTMWAFKFWFTLLRFIPSLVKQTSEENNIA